jgi:hypothetical protein
MLGLFSPQICRVILNSPDMTCAPRNQHEWCFLSSFGIERLVPPAESVLLRCLNFRLIALGSARNI